jgi:hypothetical protein
MAITQPNESSMWSPLFHRRGDKDEETHQFLYNAILNVKKNHGCDTFGGIPNDTACERIAMVYEV